LQSSIETDYTISVSALASGSFWAVSYHGAAEVKVWDVQTNREIATLRGDPGKSEHVRQVSITPDGRRAVSAAAEGTLRVWDLETGKQLRVITAHTSEVNDVVIDPLGRTAMSASDDKTLKVWDLETGALMSSFTCDAFAIACTFVGDWCVVGDSLGALHFLRFERNGDIKRTR